MEAAISRAERARHSPGRLLLVLLGCTALLTLGDQFHTQFGVISYADPGPLFGQAWWVAPGFALATLGFVVLAWPFTPRVREPAPHDFVGGALWFFGAYAASGIFGAWSLTLTALYIALWLARIVRRPDRNVVVVYSLLLALLGTMGEWQLHASGICRYEPRDFLLVPMWLPALYLQGAPLALAIARWLRVGNRRPQAADNRPSPAQRAVG